MKTKRIIISTLQLFCILALSAQTTFQKAFSGGANFQNTSITEESDNLYLMGNHLSTDTSILLLKTDTNGDMIWTKHYTANSSLADGELILQGSKRFIIGTNYQSLNASHIFISGISSTGDILWNYLLTANYNTTFAKAITIGDSAIIIVGTIDMFVDKKYFYISMVDTSGNLKWAKSVGASGNEIAQSVTVTREGNIVIVGSSYSYDASGDILLVTLNNIGDLLWSKSYDITTTTFKNQIGYDVIENNKKQFFVCGKTKTYEFSPGSEAWSPIIMKLDSSGNVLLSKRYSINSGNCGAFAIRQKSDNEYVFTGEMGFQHALITNIDSSGIANWSYYYSISLVTGTSVKGLIVLDNGYILSGSIYNNLRDSILLIKTDAIGNSKCNQGTPAGNASNTDFVADVKSRSLTISDVALRDTFEMVSADLLINTYTICNSETSVQKLNSTSNNIFPNPVIDFIHLENITDYKRFYFYNLKGQLLLEGTDKLVRIEQFKPGFYNLNVITQKGIQHFKIIKI